MIESSKEELKAWLVFAFVLASFALTWGAMNYFRRAPDWIDQLPPPQNFDVGRPRLSYRFFSEDGVNIYKATFHGKECMSIQKLTQDEKNRDIFMFKHFWDSSR